MVPLPVRERIWLLRCFRTGEGIIQSIPGDYFAELAAIAQDPALGVQDGSGPEDL